MILVDKDILNLVHSNKLIVSNFDKKNLGGVSYDLTLDKIVGLGDNETKQVTTYELNPGEAVFIKTKEMLHMPEKLLGRIAQKNSRMRMGLYVDGPHYHPGHKTYVYLRVQNLSSNCITIERGDKIAQIFFEELNGEPNQLYGKVNDAFVDEIDFKGLSSYKSEYRKHIKKIEKVKENIEEKETQIYANVLTLMGIIAAVFSLITINFQAFSKVTVDLKFVLLMNLSLVFSISVFFGLLYIITRKHKGWVFGLIYIIILLLVVSAAILIYFLL